MDKLISYFKALSDETRVRLLNILLHHELKVGEIVSVLGMGQSRISRHLKILSDAGLVESRRDGVWGHYRVPEKGDARRFTDAISYLLEAGPWFTDDLSRAGGIVEARRSETLRFFNDVADHWDMLKREIIGDFDIGGAILKDSGNYAVGVDLGCGTGDLLAAMKTHARKVIGVDRSPRMLEEARKRFPGGENIEIRLGELEHLPLGDREADLAVVSLVLQYLDNPDAAITEVARVLKPCGRFIIADFQRHNQEALQKKYGARRLGFETAEIEKWVTGSGLRIDRIEAHPLEKGLTLNIIRTVRS